MGSCCFQDGSTNRVEHTAAIGKEAEAEPEERYREEEEVEIGNPGNFVKIVVYPAIEEEGSPLVKPTPREDSGSIEAGSQSVGKRSRLGTGQSERPSDRTSKTSMFVDKVDTFMYQEEEWSDWYIDAAQELLRIKGVLKTDVTYYQSMNFNHKADVWCHDKQEMVEKVELCGRLMKGYERSGSDGSKWIFIGDHLFLPALLQGCRVVFSGDLKFKPIINEWVIDTTKELSAKDLPGIGWYCGMDTNSEVITNSIKPNGKVVKGSTTFDDKGFPWICVDTTVGFYMPIFIDGKQVAFPK